MAPIPTSSTRALERLRRALDAITDAGAWLTLPLALLLAAQWPLRDLVGAGSREANDAAQCLFALTMALAVRHATRRASHMAADSFAARYPARLRERLRRVGMAVALLPCCAWVLVAGAPEIGRSIATLEAFPDSFNPGYFVVKAAAWLLALLLALQILLDLPGAGRDAAP